jgi:hypothetical protein
MVEDNEEDSSAVIRQAKGFEASGRAGGRRSLTSSMPWPTKPLSPGSWPLPPR